MIAHNVKVGQVWQSQVSGTRYEITRLAHDPGVGYNLIHVYAKPFHGTAEIAFGSITDSGPTWRHNWILLSEKATEVVASSDTTPVVKTDSDWQFFAGVSSGNCACNIPRQQCDYHRR